MVTITANELCDLMAKLRSVSPETIWPNSDQSELRIRFRRDPFLEFMLADSRTKAVIFHLLSSE